jgi:N-formylglutamate deformylase
MSDPYKPWCHPAGGPLAAGAPLVVHGPDLGRAPPQCPLVLDSPHSGSEFPADFGAAVPEADLRTLEDSFVDLLWQPAAARGIPLLAARFPRTYLDVNRHPDDIDPDLLDAPWPGPLQPSGKAALGKALVWRLLDDGRPIYARRLSVAELRGRIERCHRPYHAALRALLDATYRHFGVVLHLNCHSMNPVAGAMGVGGAGS